MPVEIVYFRRLFCPISYIYWFLFFILQKLIRPNVVSDEPCKKHELYWVGLKSKRVQFR